MPVREMAAFSAVRVWASAPGAVAQRSNAQGERAYRSVNSESLVAESDRSSTADSLSSRAARRCNDGPQWPATRSCQDRLAGVAPGWTGCGWLAGYLLDRFGWAELSSGYCGAFVRKVR